MGITIWGMILNQIALNMTFHLITPCARTSQRL